MIQELELQLSCVFFGGRFYSTRTCVIRIIKCGDLERGGIILPQRLLGMLQLIMEDGMELTRLDFTVAGIALILKCCLKHFFVWMILFFLAFSSWTNPFRAETWCLRQVQRTDGGGLSLQQDDMKLNDTQFRMPHTGILYTPPKTLISTISLSCRIALAQIPTCEVFRPCSRLRLLPRLGNVTNLDGACRTWMK